MLVYSAQAPRLVIGCSQSKDLGGRVRNWALIQILTPFK